MAAREKATQAGKKAKAASQNPYLRRLIEDKELRGKLLQAFESSRGAYGRIQGSGLSTKVLDDKRLQRDLKTAASALRDASVTLQANVTPVGKKKSRNWSRRIMIAIAGAGLALVLSESLRGKALDLLFGAEEEFEYSSITEPSSNGEKISA